MFLTKRPNRLAALAAVGALATAALTAPSAPTSAAAGTAAVDPSSSAIVVDAGYLRLGMDRSGQVTSLVDMRSARDHVATEQGTAPLVSLLVDGAQVMPTRVVFTRGVLKFVGPGGFKVVVEVEDRTTYTTFEVTEAAAPSGGDLQAVLWGPLPTSVTHTLGESVGIVRDTEFAIGMKPLTDRTEGGWPRELWNTPVGWQNQVAGNPSNVTVAPLEEWSVGARTPWGTLLRAFTFDYTEPRTRMAVSYGGTPFPMPVGTLPSEIASVTGSKIALYGTTPDMAPTVLSNIAQEQDLPYPTIGGQWQKTAQATNQSMLILEDLNTGNVAQGAQFAVAGGMSLIDGMRGAGGPWQTNGHYQFDSGFGGSDSGATGLVNTAKAHGVRVSVHTISDFIDHNDPYVLSPANDDLAYGLSTTLAQSIGTAGGTIYLTSCAPLDTTMPGDRIRIDDEFLAYSGFREVNGQCEVTGVVRGHWISAAAAHEAGATVRRVGKNQYGGAIGGLPIIDAIATRFATVWNTTGIAGMSFDGLEEAATTGWGSYGISRLVNGTFRQQTNPDGFISETSRMTSNTWDALSRASWGESFNNIEQLFVNNLYYDANYLPGALGWIHIGGNSNVQSVEDLLARGAGLNGGTNFRTTVSSLANGSNTAKLLDAIKQWETARNLGAFTAAQRVKLQDRSTHWHLSAVTPGQSWSLQQLDDNGNPVGAAQPVVAPAPAFTTTYLPAMRAGQLYEARVSTNIPQTIAYSVTSGALPAGLTLNKDTGGITGIPTSSAPAAFTITGKGGAGTADAVRTFRIAPATNASTGALNLAPAFNNVGVTSQSNVAPGNFDGFGNSFSAEQLAKAGVTPGATVRTAGASFAWPAAAAGTPDNVAGGAPVIPAAGLGGSKIAFLGSEAGDVTDTVTVTYTDGTTSTGTIGFPNWVESDPTEFGSTLAISTHGRNLQSGYGETERSFRLFYNEIAIDPSRVIETVTLPANNKIHIFAATVANPTAGRLNLTSAFNNVAITSESDVTPGDFDGDGNSFSAEQLASAGVAPGSTVNHGAVSFTWPAPAAGTANNVAGGAATLRGEGLGGSRLAFLGSGVGDVTAPVAVTYTDGTSTMGTVSFPNWVDSTPTRFGYITAISTQGRNLQSGYGETGRTFRVFYADMAIDPTKTVATVTLPSTTKSHIFAASVHPVSGPITSAFPGKCVDDYQESAAHGAEVVLYDCNGTAGQQWTAAGDGSLRVNGKCIDVAGGGTANGTRVQIWDCNGTGAQMWQPHLDGTLRNPQSGRCLDVPRNTTTNGTHLVIWDCHGGTNQRWTLP